KAATEAVTKWKFYPIKEKGKKARGVIYVGFQYVASTGTVFSSFPFGKWEEVPAPMQTAANTDSNSKLVRISSGLAAHNKVSGSNPRYPDSAKHNRIQGTVDLRAIIDREGHIRLLQVVEAPSPDLALSAVEAVKTWQYQPYLLNGEPVE